MAKTKISITVDEDVKKQAQDLFADLGLDLSSAINIYLKRAVYEQGIPFEVTRRIPKAETLEAMEEVLDMEAHPEKYPSYDSIEALREALGV